MICPQASLLAPGEGRHPAQPAGATQCQGPLSVPQKWEQLFQNPPCAKRITHLHSPSSTNTCLDFGCCTSGDTWADTTQNSWPPSQLLYKIPHVGHRHHHNYSIKYLMFSTVSLDYQNKNYNEEKKPLSRIFSFQLLLMLHKKQKQSLTPNKLLFINASVGRVLLRGQKLNCILMGNNKGSTLQFLVIQS